MLSFISGGLFQRFQYTSKKKKKYERNSFEVILYTTNYDLIIDISFEERKLID